MQVAISYSRHVPENYVTEVRSEIKKHSPHSLAFSHLPQNAENLLTLNASDETIW
jgi:hypothetical protein